MVDDESDAPTHLGADNRPIYWDWGGENPVEVVLVAFILILFFTLPRTGCGIDNTKGNFPAVQTAADTSR